MTRALAWIGMVVAAASGCSNKLAGEIDVNGEKTSATSCRSGAIHGFPGVALTLKNGQELRIAATQTGEGELVVVRPGQKVGARVGACGPFTITSQNSTINGVRNVEGHAELDCSADGFTVKGSVTFANCH